MLEIRNLTKIYRSKAGNEVKALDNVSITFPENGMVFVLGKSGSGKSTLLNVIGGLDGCDGGEFVIKGKSSEKFGNSDFDAYRNTFIGFIFQEYNVLDDFTVGANIGLALELQGKKATSEKINDILAQVDLTDHAKRKPNELSGGQKQRVAIARALVKDPEIIMADEPTGALDSNTGKQILETLKELSKTKLVIIVSHDRDFAEKYGDRIIEMMDGRIFSDVTKHQVEATELSAGITKMNDSLLRIEQGYQLTAEDVELINEYLRNQSAEILVSGDKRLNDGVKSTAGISDNNTSSVFDETDEEKDIKVKKYEGEKTKFIRSRLPMKNAFKIGGGSLGHKKFRLVLTIILSLVAFAMFGFADSLGAYDKIDAATKSILDSNVQNASFSLGVKHSRVYPDGKNNSFYFENQNMNEEDIKLLSEKTGLDFIPVFSGSSGGHDNISLQHLFSSTAGIESSSAYTGNLHGFTTLTDEDIAKLQFEVIGEMPKADDEIAISELIYRQFKMNGFTNNGRNHSESISADKMTSDPAGGPNSIIGKHITLNVSGAQVDYKITAIINTNFEYDRYAKYVPSSDGKISQNGEEDTIVDIIMKNELANTLHYGFHSLGYITQGALEDLSENVERYGGYSKDLIGINFDYWFASTTLSSGEHQYQRTILSVGNSSDIASLGEIVWFDGAKDKLGENEILVNSSLISSMIKPVNLYNRFMSVVNQTCGEYWPAEPNGITDAIWTASIERHVAEVSANSEIMQKFRDLYPHLSEQDLLKELHYYIYSNQTTIEGIKTATQLEEELSKEIFLALLPMKDAQNLPNAFYKRAIDLLYCDFAAKEMNLTLDNLSVICLYKQAFEYIGSGSNVYNSEEFLQEYILPYNENEAEIWNEKSDDEKLRIAVDAYVQITAQNNSGDHSMAMSADVMSMFFSLAGEGAFDNIQKLNVKIETFGRTTEELLREYKIVGFFSGSHSETVICDSMYTEYENYCNENGYPREVVAEHTPGIYSFAIAPMPTDESQIRALVELSYNEDGDLQFSLQNQVMDTLGNFNEFIEIGAKVFLYVGIGFAVFSALMLMNFISVSISYKRREIGILRAVGARSSDVFKIFFCEAFIIALINFVLAVAAAITATNMFNTIVRNEGLNVTLLNFGIRQVLLMFVITLAVSAIASFLPVWNIARRKPVDAIKNK